MKFSQALELIFTKTAVLEHHQIPLEDCFGRVSAPGNLANLAVPCYDQSARDGYVLRGAGRACPDNLRGFRLSGEIKAGPAERFELGTDEACRIMTGGCVPQSAERVVAQEHCRLASREEVLVPAHYLSAGKSHIIRYGSEHRQLEEVVAAGTRLNEYHIARLADAGNGMVAVHRRPRVAFFCSGSELVKAGQKMKTGQKVSSNHYLLTCLIVKHGCIAEDFGIVADSRHDISALLAEIRQGAFDMLISTGGVGPGKYDLLAELLPQAGASILYRSLSVRPGRSTLFGLIGETLYFGLPGPPLAVSILFNELIVPALRKMQGMQAGPNRRVTARLLQELSVNSAADLLCFRPGRCGADDGGFTVRYPGPMQAPNCLILLEPGRTSYSPGDAVTISLLGSSAGDI